MWAESLLAKEMLKQRLLHVVSLPILPRALTLNSGTLYCFFSPLKKHKGRFQYVDCGNSFGTYCGPMMPSVMEKSYRKQTYQGHCLINISLGAPQLLHIHLFLFCVNFNSGACPGAGRDTVWNESMLYKPSALPSSKAEQLLANMLSLPFLKDKQNWIHHSPAI